jgi:ketosteroid isomerase-like protein
MPTLKTIALSLAATAAVTGGLLFPADPSEASRPDRQTEKRTLAFIHAVEREDLAAVAGLQHPDIVWTHPVTMTGSPEPDPVITGRDEVLGYLGGLFGRMAEIGFVDTRVSVTNDGRVSFVEADGDFTMADDRRRPYRNVYLIRLEWTRNGKLLRVDEYYNPIIACQTFENPTCRRALTAG